MDAGSASARDDGASFGIPPSGAKGGEHRVWAIILDPPTPGFSKNGAPRWQRATVLAQLRLCAALEGEDSQPYNTLPFARLASHSQP